MAYYAILGSDMPRLLSRVCMQEDAHALQKSSLSWIGQFLAPKRLPKGARAQLEVINLADLDCIVLAYHCHYKPKCVHLKIFKAVVHANACTVEWNKTRKDHL